MKGRAGIKKTPAKALKRVEQDIEKNDFGKARDRLHGLLHSYPDELELRTRLGDIYYALRHPSMAGRYWYFEKNKTPEMVKACLLFEKQMGHDPLNISRALKFKGDHETLKNLHLEPVISVAQKKVKEKLEEEQYPEDEWKEKFFTIGCITIFIFIISLVAIGIYTVFTWIF
ncbi:DUF6584 family protein [Bacillus sp. SJS]|uniref:DUF6584 family protein n=1 Tax=Bacillus sp. SJS TaxID=1423321 RepID=UPI0004DCBA9D|nr:DUF6584 family protein [Bacillus sp. SJS]KZZ84328.1 DNA helicase [Bacillus sp. SJS]